MNTLFRNPHKPRVVFLNGPPGVGKDTMANDLVKFWFANATKMKMADELKDITHRMFGLDVATDFYESVKGNPMPEFRGMTPRQAYIHVSEQIMKPLFGPDVFGHRLLQRMKRLQRNMYLIADSGFVEEAMPIISDVGPGNCLLVRLHAPKRGCSFKNDSRSHLRINHIKSVDVTNDDSIQNAVSALHREITSWCEASA